jgi:hypothetical protein
MRPAPASTAPTGPATTKNPVAAQREKRNAHAEGGAGRGGMVADTMDVHGHYLADLGRLLLEEALQARDAAVGASATDFERGQLFGLYKVLSLMQEQAVAFQIPLSELSLDGLDPDRDLIRP